MRLIEGVIVERRSLGRKLAFADIAIVTSASSVANANETGHHESKTGSTVKVIFRLQSFLGPSNNVNTDDIVVQNDNLDEPFPTKMTSLPYGAHVTIQIDKVHKMVPSNNSNNNGLVELWEVTRWKINEHPKEMAEQLASLELSGGDNNDGNDDEQLEVVDISKKQLKMQEGQLRDDSNISKKKNQQGEGQDVVTMGRGAMSCSTYLKARREAYQLAKQHQSETQKDRFSSSKSDNNEGSSSVAVNRDAGMVGSNLHSSMSTQLTNEDLQAKTKSNTANDMPEIANICIESEFHHGGKQAKAKRAKVFASWVLETFFGIITIPLPNIDSTRKNYFMDQHQTTVICQPCGVDSGASAADNNTTEADDENKEANNFHVFDIAGGKGQLSLELMMQQISYFGLMSTTRKVEEDGNNYNLQQVPQKTQPQPLISQCTIIDPMVRKGDAKHRRTKLKQAMNRVRWLQQQQGRQNAGAEREKSQVESPVNKNGDVASTHLSSNPSTKSGNDVPLMSKEMESHNDDDIFCSPIINHLATNFDAKSFIELYTQCVQSSQEDQLPTTPNCQIQQKNVQPLLLLGLHPDQCTEDIVDVALEYNFSFAIVPCCVYPDLFPHRRRMLSKNNKRVDSNTNNAKTNGASLIPVRSYDEFLQYLMDKDDRIQMATLPFEGKNKVIYKIIDEVI